MEKKILFVSSHFSLKQKTNNASRIVGLKCNYLEKKISALGSNRYSPGKPFSVLKLKYKDILPFENCIHHNQQDYCRCSREDEKMSHFSLSVPDIFSRETRI